MLPIFAWRSGKSSAEDSVEARDLAVSDLVCYLGDSQFILCETITYTGGGSYHISDFLKGAEGKDYEAVAKAFVKYTESAADYRNSVIGK